MPTNKEHADALIRPVLENWFGSDAMEPGHPYKVKESLLDPLIKRVTQELDERDQAAIPEEGIRREID